MTKIFLSCTISVGLARSARRLYVFYIYIYTFVRRARAVHARATRKRRTGRLRFNGQYNRLKTATLVLSCS